ncbi:LysM peptidoglycan-binding domain-containing protein [Pseudactinotalea terrae]|uniref:LysM peptidoglycan-binding domain-containing protein n=1 Tax=Pseudactinotalea terrae TaxID=1743262 RepID=UPI0012E1515C|nr:LysM peptidoglycan-binding domain-containing protein [Pseudactinotalea terrae]
MRRRFAGAAALALASAIGLTLLLDSLQRAAGSAIRTPDAAVALGVLAIGALLLAWYLATAVVALGCLAARAAGHAWSHGERRLSVLGAPLARRLLLTGSSAAVVAAAALSPAVAAPEPAPADLGPAVTLADDLGWGADDDTEGAAEAPSGSPDEQPVPPGPAEPASSSTTTTSHTVTTGDSLWRIAEQHLPEGATDADIALSWPRWYEQNLDVVGDDPDLIHPGQVLTAPDPYRQEEA